MSRNGATRRIGWAMLALMMTAGAHAATLRGTLTYDGLPLGSTFGSYANLTVKARVAGSSTYFSGTIDFASSTYSIPGLAPGTYDLYFLLTDDTSRSAPGWPRVGDLWARSTGRTVGPSDPPVVDVRLLHVVHLVQPLDGAERWAGGTDCPSGPALEDTFTLAWEVVPRATRYEVTVSRVSCSEILATETIPTTATSATITQRTQSGEQFLMLAVKAFGAGGVNLATMPFMSYAQGGSTGTYVHAINAPVRLPGSSTGQHVAQVANAAGVGTAFWRSDLTLTNPTGSPASTTVYFTPRGADGLTAYKEALVEVGAGASRTFTDVVSTLFESSGAGALEITSPTLVVSSRTYTTRSGGTYGQGFAPIRQDRLVTFSDSRCLIGGGVVKGAYRTNLTLNEVWGVEASVRIELYDSDGDKLGQQSQTLEPYGNLQINDVVAKVAGVAALLDGTLKVVPTGGAGKVAGTLSIVDNATDDPTTIELEPR